MQVRTNKRTAGEDDELRDLAADVSSCLWPSEPGIPVDPSVAR